MADPDERERLYDEHIARVRVKGLEREKEREREAARAAKRKDRNGGGDESSDDDRRRVRHNDYRSLENIHEIVI